jgi:hypothetical protein
MTKARDISKLLSTSNGKIAGENLDVSFENITDTGTEGTKVASGTTAQRGSTAGQIRFNSTTGLAEYYTGTAFKAIDAPPTVSSIDVTEVDSQAGGNQTIVITGSGFASGATVTFVGASGTNFNASTVTVDSDTQITVVAPKASFLNAQEPYGVKVQNISGLSNTLAGQINVDTSPSWSTASGNLGSVLEGDSANLSATATDPDGDTVSYSEITSVLSGAGFSLNSSTGAITGTASAVSADTTNTFTLRATANSKTADRSFNIITTDVESRLVNPLTTSGEFGWGNATNFTWSTSTTSGEFGSPSLAASGTPATSSTLHSDQNSYQHQPGSGDGWIGVDLGSGRSLKVYRTMVMGWNNSHYCLNNYVKGSNDGSTYYNVATWTAHPDNGGNYNRGYLQSNDNSNFFYNYLDANASDYWITATNNTAYRYFRLGGTGWDVSNNHQIVSNWWLYGLEG